MRGGLGLIQQTLRPEVAAVLTESMEEAGRRHHGHTTPLHVAATLLASPVGFLRQACVKSHPNSSHPLQCRALELCFSVALDRLPATTVDSTAVTGAAGALEASPTLPHPSNALMAALKRAQAHQRRGCPEQQQQPLLAVKVELEQLIISILDDPGVSRVMREASFSSPAVKAAIEQSLNSQFLPRSSPINQNMYSNPVLYQSGQIRNEEMSRNMHLNSQLQQPGPTKNLEMNQIWEILSRLKKKNPILVGENEFQSVMDAFKLRLEKGEFLKNIEVIPLEKDIIANNSRLAFKIRELVTLIDSKIGVRVVLDLGDVNWLVRIGVEAGKAVVDEVAKIVARFGNGRLWLIGTATCETYMRCQIYYPTMENNWDLQAVPIAPHSPFPAMFPRLGENGILNTIRRQLPENLGPKQISNCCQHCTENYERELAKLMENEYEKSSSEVRSETAGPPLIPQWLQNAKSDNNNAKSSNKSQTTIQEMAFKRKTEELEKKWSDTCLHLHRSFHNNLCSQRIIRPQMNLYNPKLLLNQPLQNRLLQNKALGASLQLNSSAQNNQLFQKLDTPPRSPVRTDLALGRPKINEIGKDNTENNRVMNLLGCISSEFRVEKFDKAIDTDSYKKLLKGLLEKVWWQNEAASKVALTVTKCKSNGNTWLLFIGPDRIGKKKMAYVISEQIYGNNPIIISLGESRGDEKIGMNLRGKMVSDRVVEAVKRNPFSVIVLENIDEANIIIRGSIQRAMERGRLADSYGREISLGNVIFILTANWVPDNFNKLRNGQFVDENKMGEISSRGWQLRLRVKEKRAKRRIDCLQDSERAIKPRKELNLGLRLDLNLTADIDDDQTDGSLNSSDLTVDHDDDQIQRFPITSVPFKFVDFIDDAIVFKPLETVSLKNEIKTKILEKFSNFFNDVSLQVEEDALEKILGGVWLGQTSFEEWGEKVLIPSFDRIKTHLPSAMSSSENFVVLLEIDRDLGTRGTGDWLPSRIRV